jgi:tripartite-type tricarboxylate transporter receptor subunit TctC
MESVLWEILADALELEFVELPFNDPAERYLSLIRGDADALVEQPGDVRPFLDRQLIKPILTLLPERIAGFEKVGSLGDLAPGFPNLMRFRGFFASGDLPAERLRYLEEAFHQAYETESFKRFNREKYMDQLGGYRDTQGAIELIREIEEVYRDLAGE